MNVFMGAWECPVAQLLEYFNLIKITPVQLFRVCCFKDSPLLLYYCLIPYSFIV